MMALRVVLAVLPIVFVCGAIHTSAAEAGPGSMAATFYVASDGNDGFPGTAPQVDRNLAANNESDSDSVIE